MGPDTRARHMHLTPNSADIPVLHAPPLCIYTTEVKRPLVDSIPRHRFGLAFPWYHSPRTTKETPRPLHLRKEARAPHPGSVESTREARVALPTGVLKVTDIHSSNWHADSNQHKHIIVIAIIANTGALPHWCRPPSPSPGASARRRSSGLSSREAFEKAWEGGKTLTPFIIITNISITTIIHATISYCCYYYYRDLSRWWKY